MRPIPSISFWGGGITSFLNCDLHNERFGELLQPKSSKAKGPSEFSKEARIGGGAVEQGSREKKQNPSSAGNAHESQRCAQSCGRGYGGVGGRRLEPGSRAGEILFCFQGLFCFGCAKSVRPSF